MIRVRSAIFQVVFYATFIVMMICGLPCLASRAATMWLVRTWAKLSLRLLRTICGTRVEFRNLELLPKGGSIIAVKHQSFFETFALITVLDDYAFVLKKELTAIPFFGWYARRADHIGIDRGRRAASLSSLQRAVRAKLAERRQIVIFPEGTRSPVGVVPVYKPGVAALVADAGVACTPVALNSGLFWPRRSFVRRPGTIVIEVLPAIQPGLGKRAFMTALQGAIEPATDALVAAAIAADPGLAQVIAEQAARSSRGKQEPATA